MCSSWARLSWVSLPQWAFLRGTYAVVDRYRICSGGPWSDRIGSKKPTGRHRQISKGAVNGHAPRSRDMTSLADGAASLLGMKATRSAVDPGMSARALSGWPNHVTAFHGLKVFLPGSVASPPDTVHQRNWVKVRRAIARFPAQVEAIERLSGCQPSDTRD